MTRTFSAYRRWRGLDGAAETMVIDDGFSWGAMLFGPIWAIVRFRWRAAAALGLGWAIGAILAAAAGPAAGGLVWVIVAYWSGASARNFEALWLDEDGWRLDNVAVARDRDLAEAMLIEADAVRADGVERRW